VIIGGNITAQVPEMGGNQRPNYELYRTDKIVAQGDASYSGDLNLSIPILTVPGRHGNNFEIIINYKPTVAIYSLL
jgi:hypothetical protein